MSRDDHSLTVSRSQFERHLNELFVHTDTLLCFEYGWKLRLKSIVIVVVLGDEIIRDNRSLRGTDAFLVIG